MMRKVRLAAALLTLLALAGCHWSARQRALAGELGSRVLQCALRFAAREATVAATKAPDTPQQSPVRLCALQKAARTLPKALRT